MALSASMEDYLEAIYEIGREKSAVRVRDVAHKLRVTMPSVTGALKNLEGRGFIRHERYEYIELTMTGAAQAKRVAARHRTILAFLTEVIGAEKEAAEKEACGIEHILGADTMEKLTRYIKRLREEEKSEE
jgi:DtxR family transcriptional regulator, Mn-dependent transcriptional regulator